MMKFSEVDFLFKYNSINNIVFSRCCVENIQNKIEIKSEVYNAERIMQHTEVTEN